ncbi:MAG: RNase adapter RapZ [Oscillospiraceae bacterium]|nr:RNase adapter RapZ [Oscillospiraceae bacterium]
MEFLIITGLSGGGKSQAADIIEDLAFYCVDNMPAALIPRFAELCTAAEGRYDKVALVADVREKNGVDEIFDALNTLKDMGVGYKILFMEAENPVIVKRYKESRRPHPLSRKGDSIADSIEREKGLMQPVRNAADFIVNTSHLTLGQLQNTLYTLFSGDSKERPITVNVMSFGFKYGIPMDADLVFDVRFLPNPFYIEELRSHSGLDSDVRDYVFSFPQTRGFMDRLSDMISFLLPQYIEEGKYSLTIGIGCTGGRHRSVAIAAALGEALRADGVNVASINRDMNRG